MRAARKPDHHYVVRGREQTSQAEEERRARAVEAAPAGLVDAERVELAPEERSEMRSHFQGYLKFRVVASVAELKGSFFDFVETCQDPDV